MVSTFTPNKKIEKPAHNDYIDSWEIPVNADWSIIDVALGASSTKNLTGLAGNQTLATAEFQPLKIVASGTPTAAANMVVPSGVGGIWVVRNNTAGGFAITISSAAGGATVTIPAGQNTLVTCDGSATGMFLAINTPGPAAGSNGQIQYNNAGTLGGSTGLTWDGTKVTTTGFTNTGNTVLGDAVGDTLTIAGGTASTPNGLNFNNNQLVLKGTPFNQVSIGTATTGSEMLTVGGAIKSTAGGYVFPDGTIQTTATSIPPGTIIAYAANTVPAGGWLMCQGQGVSTTTYAALFSVLGYSYGGSGGTFNLPDLRGRVLAAPDAGAGRLTTNAAGFAQSAVLGAAGGQEYEQTPVGIPVLGVNVGWWFGGGNFTGSGYTTGGQSVNIQTGGADSFITGLQFGGGGQAAQQHTHGVNGGTGGESLNAYINSFGASGGTNASSTTTNWVTNVQPTIIINHLIKT